MNHLCQTVLLLFHFLVTNPKLLSKASRPQNLLSSAVERNNADELPFDQINKAEYFSISIRKHLPFTTFSLNLQDTTLLESDVLGTASITESGHIIS